MPYNNQHNHAPRELYKFLTETLCREYGVFRLRDTRGYSQRNYREELISFLLEEQEVEKVLDVIELSFRAADRLTRNWDYFKNDKYVDRVDSAIEELNARFREESAPESLA